jgi:hypothetical protein
MLTGRPRVPGAERACDSTGHGAIVGRCRGSTRPAAPSRRAGFATSGASSRSAAPWSSASAPTVRPHARFREKYELPFALLADEDHSVAEAYGVWVEKTMAGKTYMGVERSTFVIDADGSVRKIIRRVKPDTHSGEVLAALPD